MAEKYYQGEDITITIEIYDESSLSTKQDLTDIEVDLILSTSKKGREVIASTSKELEGVDIIIDRINNTQLELLIPSTISATLDAGNATIEMRVRNTSTGKSTITINSSIAIESSRIGKL